MNFYVSCNLNISSKLLRTNRSLSFTLVSPLANVAGIYGIGLFLIRPLRTKNYEIITTLRVPSGLKATRKEILEPET